MKKAVIVSVCILVLLSGCVSNTNVVFTTERDGAEVSIDGKCIGTTPVSMGLSNAVWEDPSVTVRQPGYKTYYGSLDKEIKPVNLVFGLVLFWPSLLYCYGPDSEQYIQMIPEN